MILSLTRTSDKGLRVSAEKPTDNKTTNIPIDLSTGLDAIMFSSFTLLLMIMTAVLFAAYCASGFAVARLLSS